MGKNLTKQQQTMIGIAIALIAVIYLYVTQMLNPTLQEIEKAQAKYDGLLSEIETAERQARRLPALKSELEKLQADLAKLEKQLPRGKDVPNIIRTLTREALRENLEFSNFGKGKIERKTYFEIIRFPLTVSGTLHSLARFLASLGQQERIYKASDLTLTPLGSASFDGTTNLTINLNVETYAYKG